MIKIEYDVETSSWSFRLAAFSMPKIKIRVMI